MSNVKSLTTTSSDEDPTYRLTQYLQVPISTHIGTAIQRISSRIVLLGQSHIFPF